MSANNISREDISALMDNALSEERVESALTALSVQEERAAWDVYHRIGDVLRSDEMDCTFSSDFAARMATRLQAEPAIVAPVLKKATAHAGVVIADGANDRANANRYPARYKRYAIPAVAAVAVVIAIAYPQRASQSILQSPLIAMRSVGPDVPAAVAIVAGAKSASALPAMASASVQRADTIRIAQGDAANNAVVLRDPRIDEYLRAHERFSPSLYSTAQYARSASFASDADQ